MRILTWNLNGLKACLENEVFEQFNMLPKQDVICFQETRTQEQLRVLPRYYHYWYPAEEKSYSGTLTLTLDKPKNVTYRLGIKELDREGRVIMVEFGDMYIVNTYMPNS